MQPPFDLAKAQRWFAVEMNNLAWELIEAPERTPEQLEIIVDAAHAAREHWRHVGTPLNRLRAQVLLVTAYCVVNKPAIAWEFAQTALDLLEQIPNDATDYDRATVFGSAARAQELLQAQAESDRHYARMMEVVEKMTDPEDREVVLKLYSR